MRQNRNKAEVLGVEAGTGGRARRLLKRTWVRVGLVCCLMALVAGGFAVHAVIPAHANIKNQTQALTAEYGANDGAVQTAVKNALWPQKQDNWCAVSTISAVAYYTGHAVSQASIGGFLYSNSQSESEWGSAYASGGGFLADIARDGGTDPRSIAAGLAHATGGHYHEIVGFRGAWNATEHLAADLERSRQPISVTIAHGLHSILVSDVYATGDPTSNPYSITALVAWDPGVGSQWGSYLQTQRQVISIHDWLTNSDFWGAPYNANYYGSIPYDPDPSVPSNPAGYYDHNPGAGLYADLWIGHYVYLRPDAIGDPSNGVNADWAFDQNDNLIKGINGEVPSGYTGPTIPQVNKITMSDETPTAPALWSKAEYSAVSGGPNAVLAWIGTDSARHLNVSESSGNGMSYGNKRTLNGLNGTTNETSNDSPSVLVVPNTDTVVLGWRGTDSAGHLNVMYDVYGTNGGERKLTLPETSPYPPSIAYFNNQLWIAWTGSDNGHSLNVAAITDQNGQLAEGTKTTLWSYHGGTSPKLVPDTTDNQLLLSWQNNSANLGLRWLEFARSADGATWTFGAQTAQTSIATPDMLVVNQPPAGMQPYYWSWTGTDSSGFMNIMQTAALSNWAVRPITFGDTTATTPVLGYAGGYNGHANELLLLWTGTDRAHHMNIATIAV